MDDTIRIRNRIDELDLEIVRLLKNRYENARLLGRIKSRRGLEYKDPEREKIILRKVERAATEIGLEPELVRPIFEQIFPLSIEAQKNPPQKAATKLEGAKILVVGGSGGMGRLFARFFALEGANIKLAGREIEKTRTASKELEVETGTILDAANSDIVLLSVPMEETVRVATETASLMAPGSLILDLSSVKTGISDKIAGKIPKAIEYLSLHPLFGPYADHLHGQIIVTVTYHVGQNWPKLARALQVAGAKLVPMSAAQHDKAMAYAQGLHHYALISLGLGLGGMGGEPRTQSLRDTENRIASLLDNWDTIVGIQQLNPFVVPVRQKFVESVNKMSEIRTKQYGSLKRRLSSNVQKWSRKL